MELFFLSFFFGLIRLHTDVNSSPLTKLERSTHTCPCDAENDPLLKNERGEKGCVKYKKEKEKIVQGNCTCSWGRKHVVSVCLSLPGAGSHCRCAAAAITTTRAHPKHDHLFPLSQPTNLYQWHGSRSTKKSTGRHLCVQISRPKDLSFPLGLLMSGNEATLFGSFNSKGFSGVGYHHRGQSTA